MEAKENLLNGIKQKFAEVRTTCPGMPEDVYYLTDYISEVANDSLVPLGLVNTFALAIEDVQKGTSEFRQDHQLPENLRNHRGEVLTHLDYVPQIVDEIADENFSEEFRYLCRLLFSIDPPKRENVDLSDVYPKNVCVAIDWWANAIQAPTINGISNTRSYTKSDIERFKTTLAEIIIDELEDDSSCSLYVDYHPCQLLAKAGDEIEVNDIIGYPFKTWMKVTYTAVEVKESIGSPFKTIWSSEKNDEHKKKLTPNS